MRTTHSVWTSYFNSTKSDRHEYRAEPNRTHDSLSTLRVSCRPILARSDGSAASSSCSMTSRSADTAQDLAVHDAVDLGAPGRGRRVPRWQVTERHLRDHQT
jgi:hypothetical protein